MINLINISAQNKILKNEIMLKLNSIIDTADFINGSEVKLFEDNFKSIAKSKHVVPCANGTDALEIALTALGVGANDEVLVPAMTWVSTAGAVKSVGATPIFVDIDKKYFTIDPEDLLTKITPKTKAIIPVHLYGQPCDMDAIKKIALENDLKIVEDCAQAHGASIRDKLVGTWGDIATYSFYPSKNLGAFGDAGAITTDNEELAIKCRMIANHGALSKGNNVICGRNSRMDNMQAAILNVKIKYFHDWTSRRVKNANFYNALLNCHEIITPKVRSDAYHVFHLYTIKIGNRDQAREFLFENNIATTINYPRSVNNLPAFNGGCYTEVADQFEKELLCLPLCPYINKSEQEQVATKILEFVNESVR